MGNLFFTADTHFNHTNIIRYCDRPFDNVHEMNECIIKEWNAVVKPKDIVYHLGDFGFGQDTEQIFGRLNGTKRLIIGNHDNKQVFRLGWDWVKDVHQLRYYDYRVWLSHYAHRTWPGSFHGSWHLFGHTHGTIRPYGKSLDVGVDVWDFMLLDFDLLTILMPGLPHQTEETKGAKKSDHI